jgi:hypothetical protein
MPRGRCTAASVRKGFHAESACYRSPWIPRRKSDRNREAMLATASKSLVVARTHAGLEPMQASNPCRAVAGTQSRRLRAHEGASRQRSREVRLRVQTQLIRAQLIRSLIRSQLMRAQLIRSQHASTANPITARPIKAHASTAHLITAHPITAHPITHSITAHPTAHPIKAHASTAHPIKAHLNTAHPSTAHPSPNTTHLNTD